MPRNSYSHGFLPGVDATLTFPRPEEIYLLWAFEVLMLPGNINKAYLDHIFRMNKKVKLSSVCPQRRKEVFTHFSQVLISITP